MNNVIFFLVCLTVFHFSVVINQSEDFDSDDYQLYGPTLAANDQFIIAIQNRTGITFSAIFDYSTSPKYCSVTYTPTNGLGLYATMIAIGRNALASLFNTNFVFIGYSTNNYTTHFYIASINFPSCQVNILDETVIFNTTYPSYSVLGVNSNGTIAFYLSDTNIYMQSLISPYTSSKWSSIIINPTTTVLIPVAFDLSSTWGVLGCYMRQSSSSSSTFRPTLYLVNFESCLIYKNASCFIFSSVWQMTYVANWQPVEAPATSAASYSYNSLYDMSISINDNNSNVLLGVQSVNTVFRFTASSTLLTFIGSRYLGTIPSIGYGKGVGWLDNTTAAILVNNFTIDYIQWRSSVIELYPITTSNSLSNTISPYASYPNSRQQLWSQLNPQLIDMHATPGSGALIYMDYVGQVHVILPSSSGYYVYTRDGIGEVNNTIYIAPTVRCTSGTIKNQTASGKDLFRYCLLCPEGSFYSANLSNTTNQCIPCNTTVYFCPWGAVTALPISALDIISQAQVYPQSPENDVFEDLLLINMLNLNFSSDCLTKQPLFFALIIIGVGCLILLFMGILKLTGKCKKQRRIIKNIFKQTDLIGEGELWIGGVASFAIMVIAIFAYKFSSAFINQYPIETAPDATFACDLTLRNAKFSTSMQSLGTPFVEEEQPIFDMLDNQSFTLNVAFINTDFTADNLTVSQVLGSILVELPRQAQVDNGILEISTNLTSHTTTIAFNVSSNSAVGGLRVGLTGPSISNGDYYVQELNFSSVFYESNRTIAQDPLIQVQLIQLINTTEPLSASGVTKYSALWIPTFIINTDQLYLTDSEFELYHIEDNTVLTIQITEATYYIYNKQEPIAKLTEVIFTDILFTTMCIELFALTFLFYKLAISPIIKALLRLCKDPNQIQPKGSGNPECPYCRSVDADTLPAYRVPVQRPEQDTPMYPIRRQTPDITKL